MFKRVDKRRRKKEEEEKLGLDEEVKEILGIHDTDSEESDSDSDSDEGEEEEEEEESVADDDEMNSGEEDEDDEEDDDEEEEDPSITVSQALKDPLYIVSVLPDIKACIVCPGKLLKSLKMVQLHRTSNAHIRRFKRFSDSSANAKPNDNAWDILKRDPKTKPKLSLTASSGVSKRAEKKKKASQARKARRIEAKVKAKAKKAKATPESKSPDNPESKSPLKKKRKIDMEQVLPSVKTSTPPPATKKRNKKESANTKPAPAASVALEDDDNARGPPNVQDSVKVQDIVKFASNRAKTARSRALSMSKKASRPTKSAIA